ncbi:chaperone protein HscA [Alphaproteobacteria bacterium]|nr:chaperone protein HscA [Alphaproteobacteria bacterium]
MSIIQIQEPGALSNDLDSNEIIIGIDLGTTNSIVGAIINNKVKLFCDENNRDIFPSIVNFNDKGQVISVAKNQECFFSVSSIKRLMGKNFDDIKQQNILAKKYLPKIAKNCQNQDSVSLQIADKTFLAVEISAEILKFLKKIAEKNLQQSVKKVVISVPAYFDEQAKNATKQSAQIAGLEVVRLINEPTASALAYGLDNNSQGIFAVYDLGGGTFDVSVLKIVNGVFRVLGVSGDNHLGGDDFDHLLEEYGFKNPRLAKESLSLNPEYSEGSLKITQKQFEKLILENITKTVKICENLLEDLEIHTDQLNGIILVGGSTRIPLIKKLLIKSFGNKILTNIDPDRVVAIGACHQAHNLSQTGKNLLLDVNPLSLGVEMMGGIVDKIIYRNSTIPISKTKEFTTYADNQTGMKIHIVQGEGEFAKDCRSLGEFEIKNIPAMIAGLAQVAINFSLDADGLLTVSATEKLTNSSAKITIKPSFSLSEEQVKEMLLKSLKNSKDDIQLRLLTQAIIDANQDLTIIKKDLKNNKLKITTKLKKLLNQKICELEELIAEKKDKDLINNCKDQLIKIAQPLVLQKVNKTIGNQIVGKKIDNF